MKYEIEPVGSELPVCFAGDWDVIDFTDVMIGIGAAKDNFTTVGWIASISAIIKLMNRLWAINAGVHIRHVLYTC